MFANRSKLVLMSFLLLLPLLCLAGGVALAKRYQQTYGCYDDRPPLRSFNVTIDNSQSQMLIEQLEKFANKNGFSYKISYYTPNGEDFSVWMEREDVEVVTASPFTRGEFKIGFYNNDCVDPTLASEISGLVSDLESFVGEIPSVTITEEK